MSNFAQYKRTDLIKLLRLNKQYLPDNVLKYTKIQLEEVLNKAQDLDLSILPSFVPMKEKKVKDTPLQKPQPVVKPPVVLDELSDSSEDEQPIPERKQRLVRKKAEPPIKQPVPVKALPQPIVKQPPVVVKPLPNNKENEMKVKQLLKEYAEDCRELLDNYADEIDDYDVQCITDSYNDIRECYENAIDDIIEGLELVFSDKFYTLISKMLDQSLNKIQNFIK